jgi:hypothetical protein
VFKCDPAAVIKEANSLTSSGEPRSDLFQLNQLALRIEQQNQACTEAALDAINNGGTPVARTGDTATPTTAATMPRLTAAAATRTAASLMRTATASAVAATKAFLAEYKPINWKELNAYADRHRGEKIILQGSVAEVRDDHTLWIWMSGSFELAEVQTKESLSGIYQYDWVKVYGTVAGVAEYTHMPLIKDAFVTKS